MLKRKVLVVAAVVVLAVMCVPLWGAQFRRMNDQQFIDMCKDGDTQGVIKAIRAGAEVNAKNKNGWTALMWVAMNGHTEIVNVLIKAGAEVNAKNKNGWTALIAAANKGHAGTANALIEAGADDLTDNNGKTALIHAAESDNPDTVNALIEAGSYVKQKDKSGKTALDYARKNPKLKGSSALKRLEDLSR